MRIKAVEFTEKRKYPYLGRHKSNNHIVLFSAKGKGTVVDIQAVTTDLFIGLYSEYWNENSFNYFKGTVTMSNDEYKE